MIALKLASAVRLTALAFVSLLFLAAPASADLTLPDLEGKRVVDDAHILPAADQAALTAKLADLETKTTDQFVVVTVPSLQGDAIEDFGYKLGRKWGIGQKGKNNGILLLVAPTEHKVRIEVGYGLEPVMTDALSSVIIQERILPKFRAQDLPGGVNAGVDSIIQQLTLDKPQAIAKAQAAAKPRHGGVPPMVWIILFIVIVFTVRTLGAFRLGPFMFLNFLGGSSTWRGGGGDGDSFGGGGGGFSGGGGSFGGGGASGGW
jgi:uncharacterized protein